MSSKSKGQKARIHENVKGVKGRVDMSRYVKTCTNTRKITKLIFILKESRGTVACTLQKLTKVSLPLCLSPHDAFATYTYLHCPMRLSRLGNLFA
jgi:hypothetical protein